MYIENPAALQQLQGQQAFAGFETVVLSLMPDSAQRPPRQFTRQEEFR
jgi:hypothetical protein